MDIIVLVYFIIKIVSISKTKGIAAKAWVLKLVIRWFTIEIGIIVSCMLLFNITLEDNRIFYVAIPTLALAISSALYTVRQLQESEDDFTTGELEIEEQNFDHFR
ncbi:MAG: hypothetical protein ACI8ZX_000640 [Planctomycetota bacterium]|jgi:hypothetical protein